jgi:CBS domain-containing protein
MSAVPNAFNFSAAPFDCLSGDERRLVRDSVDIVLLHDGQQLLAPGEPVGHVFVLIQGHVQQWEGGELLATFGTDDCFDGRALAAGQASHRFVATGEGLAYRLPQAAVAALIARNAGFGAQWFALLSQRLAALSDRQGRHELQSLTMARVDQAVLRSARIVDAATDIVTVVRLFNAQRITSVLVRDASAQPERMGIFTTAGLQRAILRAEPLDQLSVGTLATYPLVTVKSSDHLYDALATMIRHRVQRVVVVGDGAAPSDAVAASGIVGMLEQIDLLSFLSNHSYLVTRQILDADDLPALDAAAAQITRVIGLLHRGGTRVGQIARLVQALNAQLFERAWQLLAPPELVANSCLFVMGSEGRGEQLLKTDQDNGLILRDGYSPPDDLAAICDRFSAALAGFGYPDCPGRIMLNNPDWRHPAAEFGQTVRRWLLLPTPDSLMALAIFIDAHAVCGDARLLEQVRGEVFMLVTDNDALLARFAAAINAFDGEGGSTWWLRLFAADAGREQLDLKKAGTFPLVHGVRALALAERLPATGTAERIAALVAAQRLPVDLGADLVEALHVFMRLKLDAGLAALETGSKDSQTDSRNGIAVDRLGSADRDLLKDALGVVKRFKTLLRLRFHLDAV